MVEAKKIVIELEVGTACAFGCFLVFCSQGVWRGEQGSLFCVY
jgi:hypothetical protein